MDRGWDPHRNLVRIASSKSEGGVGIRIAKNREEECGFRRGGRSFSRSGRAFSSAREAAGGIPEAGWFEQLDEEAHSHATVLLPESGLRL